MHKLQDDEVFPGYYQFPGQTGSFEVFWDDADEANGHARNYDGEGNKVEPGWYWWACFPGCLPDGEPSGPFKTAKEAHDDAMNV